MVVACAILALSNRGKFARTEGDIVGMSIEFVTPSYHCAVAKISLGLRTMAAVVVWKALLVRNPFIALSHVYLCPILQ